jgi:hypothetical protein
LRFRLLLAVGIAAVLALALLGVVLSAGSRTSRPRRS